MILTVLCVGTSVVTPLAIPGLGNGVKAATVFLPMLLPVGCLPFVIRSYAITADAILIRRLFWTTRIERAGLQSAEAVPNAMRGSLRTCGNGGGYSITGWYWSKRLGFYRAYVTDLKGTVILRFVRRTVVISPSEPEEFVKDLGLPPQQAHEICA